MSAIYAAALTHSMSSVDGNSEIDRLTIVKGPDDEFQVKCSLVTEKLKLYLVGKPTLAESELTVPCGTIGMSSPSTCTKWHNVYMDGSDSANLIGDCVMPAWLIPPKADSANMRIVEERISVLPPALAKPEPLATHKNSDDPAGSGFDAEVPAAGLGKYFKAQSKEVPPVSKPAIEFVLHALVPDKSIIGATDVVLSREFLQSELRAKAVRQERKIKTPSLLKSGSERFKLIRAAGFETFGQSETGTEGKRVKGQQKRRVAASAKSAIVKHLTT